MATNKPEVVAYLVSMKSEPELGHWFCEGAEHPEWVKSEPLIRLSDYEALQAKYERLLKHLQNLIDQTTPLEPEPGNPMWSRRIQLDEVIAERDSLRAECEKLRKDADQYRRLLELGEDFQWENIIRMDIEDFPSRAAAIDEIFARLRAKEVQE